jgi:hypothetical protein
MSITTWTRIEPDILTGDPQVDLAEGIAARLADPLWLIGRQWQMRELQGEDAGSPISAQVIASTWQMDRINSGPQSRDFAAATTPAEALVEHDGSPADLRMRASAGTAFLDQLTEAELPQYAAMARTVYSFTATPAGILEAVLINGNVDADRVLADAFANQLASALSVTSTDIPAFEAVVEAWLAWYRPRGAASDSTAWVPDRLEYAFSMEAGVPEGRLTLTAPEHHGGAIDWDSFHAETYLNTAPQTGQDISANGIPVVLEIPGMPSPWFWALENSRFDTGRIEAGASDTARLLLIEAAMAYASDWFLLPIHLPMASLSRLSSVQIIDTFGVSTLILDTEEVVPDSQWSLWRVTQGTSKLPYMLLPPPESGSLISDPIEQFAFVRDEAANLAWAHPLIPRANYHAPPLPSGPGDLIYIPVTPLPDSRVPLVLTEANPGERFLVRAGMVNQPDSLPTPMLSAQFRVRDEEIPDEGLTLSRRFELGRTPDGKLHLWISRAAVPGARLPASGLVFDKLVPGNDSAVG